MFILKRTMNIQKKNSIQILDFSVCAPPPLPQLSMRVLIAPPVTRAIFLHNDLQRNGTRSVTGWRVSYWGGAHAEKIRIFLLCELRHQLYFI